MEWPAACSSRVCVRSLFRVAQPPAEGRGIGCAVRESKHKPAVEAPRERDVYSEYVERAPAGRRRQPSPFPINTAIWRAPLAVVRR